jgi:O-succinylbenzoic acid--CoA ligase
MSGFEALTAAWQQGRIMPLTGPTSQERQALAAAIGPTGLADLERRWGPGVVLGSGGSTGERRWCLQPLIHLRRSAEATGRWLGAIGIEPSRCLHLNPLPSHHVSGLLPPLRAELWGAAHQVLPPVLLRDPAALAATVKLPAGRPVLLSLVPTQLRRLMARPEGLAWLRRLAVIWVGGAPLPSDLALSARRAGLPLAPCYGATETAAMVCALPPDRFLAGVAGCGQPLADVRLRLDAASGAVELQTDRLSPGWLVAGMLQPLPRCDDGWWRSSDAGRLAADGLDLVGRLDGAIHSGGETVFPEQLEQRLWVQAGAAGLPLQALLLLPLDDSEWGQRLVALVRPKATAGEGLLERLVALTASWAPAERPLRWLLCPHLAPDSLGKWQRNRWRQWLVELKAGSAPPGTAAGRDGNLPR